MTEKNKISPDLEIFQRLSLRYLLALIVIALVVIISNFFIQKHLDKQISDSRVVNVSGRQRMLSQKLSKLSLQITASNSLADRTEIAHQMRSTLELWTTSHEGLKVGSEKLNLPGENSIEVLSMFSMLQQPFEIIVSEVNNILTLIERNPNVDDIQLNPSVVAILEAEGDFLLAMDNLVFQYDLEAKSKVEELRKVEYTILAIALMVLLLEFLFIFLPTASYVRKTIREFSEAKKEALDKAEEIKILYGNKEKSLQELRALNFVVDQAMLFANISLDGNLIYMSDKLLKFLGHTEKQSKRPFAEWMSIDEAEQQNIEQIIRSLRTSIWEGEIPITTQKGEKKWLEIGFIPVNKSRVQQDYLIICHDITSRILAQQKIDQLNQRKFDEEFEEQKLRSAQVIVAQENERKRIAKDMHDSIGQMLTSLKFNLEGINLDKPERAKVKLEELKQVASSVIKGVRMATFNLTPPELSDYGVVPAIKKLIAQAKKLTNKNIIFDNRTDFNGRFDEIVETNIYRICQEAVNNAIKYAQSSYILVTISHSQDLMSLVIDDDGIGFDVNLDPTDKEAAENSGNMGLTFMKERVQFINGRLFINSTIGEGTRITLNVPMSTESQLFIQGANRKSESLD